MTEDERAKLIAWRKRMVIRFPRSKVVLAKQNKGEPVYRKVDWTRPFFVLRNLCS